jgi:hypothetical protein
MTTVDALLVTKRNGGQTHSVKEKTRGNQAGGSFERVSGKREQVANCCPFEHRPCDDIGIVVPCRESAHGRFDARPQTLVVRAIQTRRYCVQPG